MQFWYLFPISLLRIVFSSPRGRGSGQSRLHQKQEGVRENVQIEIDEAVCQNGTAGGKCPDMKRQIQGVFCSRDARPCRAKEDHKKTGAYDPADHAGLREGLHIIIVRVVYDRAVVERFVSRKNVLQGAEPGSCHRVVEENSPGVFE